MPRVKTKEKESGGNQQSNDSPFRRKLNFSNVAATKPPKVSDKSKNRRKRKRFFEENTKSGCSSSTRDTFSDFEEPLDYEPSTLEIDTREESYYCVKRPKISPRTTSVIKRQIIENTNIPIVKLSNINSDLLPRKNKSSNSNLEMEEDSEENTPLCQVKEKSRLDHQRDFQDEGSTSSNNYESASLSSENCVNSRETENQIMKHYSQDQGMQGNPPVHGNNYLNNDSRTAVRVKKNLQVKKKNFVKSHEVIKKSIQNSCRNGRKVDYFHIPGQMEENSETDINLSHSATNSKKPYPQSTSPNSCSKKIDPVNISIKVSTVDNQRFITGGERPQKNDEGFDDSHSNVNNDRRAESTATSSSTACSYHSDEELCSYNSDEEIDSPLSMSSEQIESQLELEPEELEQSGRLTSGANMKTHYKVIPTTKGSQQDYLHSTEAQLNTRLQKPDQYFDNGKFSNRKWTSKSELDDKVCRVLLQDSKVLVLGMRGKWSITTPIMIDATSDFEIPDILESELTFKILPQQTNTESENIRYNDAEIGKRKSDAMFLLPKEPRFKRLPQPTRTKLNNNPYSLAETIEESKSDVLSLFPESDIDVPESNVSEKSIPSNSKEASPPSDAVQKWIKGSVNERFDELFFKKTCLGWMNGNCARRRCKFYHYLSQSMQDSILSLDFGRVMKLYNYSKKNIHRHKALFSIILAAFSKFPDNIHVKEFLVGTVKTILDINIPNKIDFIKQVIDALTLAGESFSEVTRMIISEHGVSNMELCDILLNLIVSRGDLRNDWNLLPTLLSNRNLLLGHAVVTNLLKQCINTKPSNIELLTYVKEEILDKKLVEVWKIADTVEEFYEVYNNLRNKSVPDYLLATRNPEVSPDSKSHFSEDNSELDDKSEISITSVKSNRSKSSSDSFSASSSCSSSSSSDGYRKRTDRTSRSSSKEIASSVDSKLRPSSFQNKSCASTSDGTIKNTASVDVDFRYLESCPSERDCQQMNLSNDDQSNHYRRNDIQINVHHTTSSIVSTDEDLRVSADEDLRVVTPKTGVLKYVTYEYNDNRKNVIGCRANCKFGHLQLNKNFVFSKSLHKDYLTSRVNIDIETKDITSLKDCIERTNAEHFMHLLEKYRSETTIEKFICHVLVFLMRSPNMFFVLKNLIHLIEEKNPYFLQQQCYKAAFEVIVFNSLFYLECKGDWGGIIYLLRKFNDWDSLITSKCLDRLSIKYSLMGRYIYLCKIFINADNRFWPNEIFQSDHLNLLKSTLYWPFVNLKEIDIDLRNKVLESFFKKDFWMDNSVNDLYKCIARLGGVTGYDVWSHFNSRVLWLLKNYKVTFYYIRCFLRDLINVYAKYLETTILRSITICIPGEVIEENVVSSFYDMCCERGVYDCYDGNEITIRNNMLDPEIALVLHSFFKKLPRNNLPTHLHICVYVSRGTTTSSVILNIVRSAADVTQSIVNILSSCFQITGHYIESPVRVIVPFQSLLQYVKNPTYTYVLPPFIPRVKELISRP